jgi:tRNA threonylcarbamoyladenosine biosynthesis protein TsaE
VTVAIPAPSVVADVDAMRALGAQVALGCRAGDVVVLSGPLGAGKTTFTQGFASGLQVAGAVTSPTFVIARVHRSTVGGPDLVHVDAYRLGGLPELDDLDLDVSLAESVTVVEWGEGLAEDLSAEVVTVRIERDGCGLDVVDPTSDRRRVTLTWPTGRGG